MEKCGRGPYGKAEVSLITEPKFAHDAAAVFREMKQFEEVDLINSKAIEDSEPRAMENSLYEAVETKEAYVDVCLKRYLGHIIKCHSVEELEQVKDGVTPDCYPTVILFSVICGKRIILQMPASERKCQKHVWQSTRLTWSGLRNSIRNCIT